MGRRLRRGLVVLLVGELRAAPGTPKFELFVLIFLIGASFGMVPGARTFRFFTEAGLGLSPTENRSVKTGARLQV